STEQSTKRDRASSAVNPGATEICDSLDNNCNGTTDEGCGSRILTGEFLGSDYDTKIYGDSQNDYFGSAVAGGDFNGDGLVDIAVGAPDDEYSTNSNLGVVYLYNGAMASGVQLCTDQDDALLYSNSSGSYPDFGEFMWTLPDYSGDGRPELAVGSNQNYYNQIAVFTAGPYSGALSLATRTTSYTCSDISGSGNFSSTVGNGVACGYVSSGTAAGVVYIYGYGSSVPVATLNPEAGAKLTGYGLDVEQDIDGDGVNDAVVGAPQANTGGAAYIVMGPVNGSFNLANYDLKIQGPSSAGSIAERVLVAELDGDGRMDIVISDHNYNYGSRSSAGAFRVVTSLPSGILSWDQADTSIYGSARADGLGYHPASSGDVDGDGTGDLLVSSWGNGGNGVASGVAWLLYGPLSAATVDLATDYDARWFGESTYTYLGTAAIIAGDTNGDGFDDVVLNSVFGDEGSAVDRGAVWLFLGG
ncbi:MAG TPA: FG-GAP-like repeat-containing protein, partial [Myxococcota bacterium]|nr:FG-GAP-like repeat-containing protein [Myxococcota bacterium]